MSSSGFSSRRSSFWGFTLLLLGVSWSVACVCEDEGNSPAFLVELQPATLEIAPGEERQASARAKWGDELLPADYGPSWSISMTNFGESLESWEVSPADGSSTTATLRASTDLPSGKGNFYNGNAFSSGGEVKVELEEPVFDYYSERSDDETEIYSRSKHLLVHIYEILLVPIKRDIKATYALGEKGIKFVRSLEATLVVVIENDKTGLLYSFDAAASWSFSRLTPGFSWETRYEGSADTPVITLGSDGKSAKIQVRADLSEVPATEGTAQAWISTEIVATRSDGRKIRQWIALKKNSSCYVCG